MSAILSADDLNDFITPGAACIKPPTQKENPNNGEVEVQIGMDGDPLEVSKIDGSTSNLSPAQISLADCLACSGCITSAEEILVAQHSHQELLKALNQRDTNTHFVASVSHQSRASLATALGVTVEQADRLLINLFVNQMGFQAVVGTSLGRKLSLISESYNIIHKKESNFEGPLLSSVCPGWVLYAEKTHPYILPKMSDIKSPQQITGCLLKNIMAEQLGTDKSNIYHLSIMPCFDKKLESARPEKGEEESTYKDVDCVLTAKELVTLLDQHPDTFKLIPDDVNDVIHSRVSIQEIYKQVAPVNWPLVEYAWSNDSGSASGGYSHNYLTIMKNHLMTKSPELVEDNFSIKTIYGKNTDIYELRLMYNDEKVASAAIVNGFRNIQNLVRRFKPSAPQKATAKVNPLVARRRARMSKPSGEGSIQEELADASKCDYVEVMACPNGCINGGGQISHPEDMLEKDWLLKAVENYQLIPLLSLDSEGVLASIVPDLISWSQAFTSKFDMPESRLFRTWFKEVEKPTDPNAILLGAKW
ncbi:Cytosolic Fe-S cluster assembly factor nar1 [Yamadazyma tenuis]|uniref:Cytosolic Fe-S cluster assembly factor NAR1 n=1 Tax=Candida tenuis (strain ATCC 10573 / BCRC 21748 / CBS 615 / JCM 9827 / NBRC 10315 / NRRL Y-1498 / VKM Y-70) TaxID=590646 RepID=G3B8L3_CANTC|nr:uncharacterized protein CANTEDRAFT_109743 [Yamadazyma tenuis ATCC 10573]EGV61763.1 hypothetical protein CANTEDRAFT_109743 [Yamadazyma tenuis ATCC 10573]WEJ92990.1 Cytosolic Fe-S cluster assembly factor nar1 [Yamadazyma tenuis]